MSCSSREDDHVTGAHLQDSARASAKLYARASARNLQDLMCLGVEMQKIIEAVAPRVFPTVGGEQFLEDRGGIERRLQNHRRAVEHERKVGIVRGRAIVGEFVGVRLAFATETSRCLASEALFYRPKEKTGEVWASHELGSRSSPAEIQRLMNDLIGATQTMSVAVTGTTACGSVSNGLQDYSNRRQQQCFLRFAMASSRPRPFHR